MRERLKRTSKAGIIYAYAYKAQILKPKYERKVVSCLNIIPPAANRADIMMMAACARVFPAVRRARPLSVPRDPVLRGHARRTVGRRARVRPASARRRVVVPRRAGAKSA